MGASDLHSSTSTATNAIGNHHEHHQNQPYSCNKCLGIESNMIHQLGPQCAGGTGCRIRHGFRTWWGWYAAAVHRDVLVAVTSLTVNGVNVDVNAGATAVVAAVVMASRMEGR